MKRIILLLIFQVLIFPSCEKDTEVNLSLIPGHYYGSLSYWDENDGPAGFTWIDSLSTIISHHLFEVQALENHYIIYFDSTQRLAIPDLEFEISRTYYNASYDQGAEINLIENEYYSLTTPPVTQDYNTISFNMSLSLSNFNLCLLSKDTNNVHRVDIQGTQHY